MTKKSDYDLYLSNLLKLVRKKGVLVKRMKKGSEFMLDTPHKQYKKALGDAPVYNIFGNIITNVYVVYEDYDGTIKYYDYPQYSCKEIKSMRKRYEESISKK